MKCIDCGEIFYPLEENQERCIECRVKFAKSKEVIENG